MKTAVAVPDAGSWTLTASGLIATVRLESSSRMIPSAVVRARVAPAVGLERARPKDSLLASMIASPITFTVAVWLLTPGAKVRVVAPRGVKSVPEVAAGGVGPPPVVFTVTAMVCSWSRLRVRVKTAGVVPLLPSTTETSWAPITWASSSVMVAVPMPVVGPGPVPLEKVTRKVSFTSSMVSPKIGTVRVWLVLSAGNVTVPVEVVKSAPAVAGLVMPGDVVQSTVKLR